MFNKFAMAARAAVLTAAREAQAGAAPAVTDEHLLLALLATPHTRSAGLLESAGITTTMVDAAFRSAERKGGLSDSEAESLLRELGIDVDQVVATVEESLGEGVLTERQRPRSGRVPFAGTAKTILRGALDEAKSQNEKELRDEHLLLAIAAHDGVAGQLLSTHGLSYLDLRTQLAKAS
jgi:ATP-dependent Clp protease ATP-binding subunit ClpA